MWTIHDDDSDFFVTMVVCVDVLDSERGDFRCRLAVDTSSFNGTFASKNAVKFQSEHEIVQEN